MAAVFMAMVSRFGVDDSSKSGDGKRAEVVPLEQPWSYGATVGRDEAVMEGPGGWEMVSRTCVRHFIVL
jgi:hypothetical protein